MGPKSDKQVKYRTDFYRRTNRIGPGEIVGGVVVLLVMAGLFLLLIDV